MLQSEEKSLRDHIENITQNEKVGTCLMSNHNYI